ncbi:hypothetical protein GLYMA_11G144450v4 [Glycine max]|nr:hypothetical protein GLYMA_11G144450v4 [Glycine max]KAH1159148.1 hypothetical protein GYH30_031054 [Glycine max]
MHTCHSHIIASLTYFLCSNAFDIFLYSKRICIDLICLPMFVPKTEFEHLRKTQALRSFSYASLMFRKTGPLWFTSCSTIVTPLGFNFLTVSTDQFIN